MFVVICAHSFFCCCFSIVVLSYVCKIIGSVSHLTFSIRMVIYHRTKNNSSNNNNIMFCVYTLISTSLSNATTIANIANLSHQTLNKCTCAQKWKWYYAKLWYISGYLYNPILPHTNWCDYISKYYKLYLSVAALFLLLLVHLSCAGYRPQSRTHTQAPTQMQWSRYGLKKLKRMRCYKKDSGSGNEKVRGAGAVRGGKKPKTLQN